MFNYKKSLLSVVAVLVLSIASVSADYIPLTDTGNHDEVWTLFGVTGLKIGGAGAGTSAGTFSITDNTANALTDATQDELYVEGLVASTGENLAKLKVLEPYASIEVRVDTTGSIFNETEPVRTMYVTMEEGGGPAFAFNYRASLESHTMQYSINTDGSDAHTVTISSANTYSNPALGAVIQEIAGIDGSSLGKLSEIVDYNFSNNPSNSAYYDEDNHQDEAVSGQYLRIYSYDAGGETWNLYDSRNTEDANDFTELVKGKAYWAKMDDNDAASVGGLVLGSSSISTAEYVTAGIADGWNLMAFDNANTQIRRSETGLILALGGDGNITIYDSSANHGMKVELTQGTVAKVNTSCKKINNAIKQAKLTAGMPDTFDLKAFDINATHVVLLSNKRFLVEDNDGVVTRVTTLTGAYPYTVDPANITNTDDSSDVTDLGSGASSVMSKYGEYAMIIEPIYLAQAAGAAKIHVQSAASDSISKAAVEIGADISATVTAVGNGITGVDMGGYKTYAQSIDVDYNGTVDHILISSREPFYIRDHTFTRVFKYTDTNVDGNVYIKGTGTDVTIALGDDNDTATVAAAQFNGHGDVNASVDPGASTKFVIISDKADSNEFTITEATTTDHLEDTTSTSDLAKGAVKGVYSTSSFVTNSTENNITFTILTADIPDATTDQVKVYLKNTIGQTYTGSEHNASTTGLDHTTWKPEFKTLIESGLSAANILADVTADSNGTGIYFTIVGSDILDINYTWVGSDENNLSFNSATVDVGTIVTTTPDLSSDLKFNAVYAPNYVPDGPLYTMKEAGYTLKALVTGTTDISDGSINWDSIDLTRKPSEWLDSQEYNLFSVSETSGYWAYLESDGATNDLAVSNAVITPIVYTYHINAIGGDDNDTGTNYNHISGNIALTIDGLNDYDDRKSAVIKVAIAGSEVELANIAGSDVYTGKISSYEVESMITGYNYEVLATLADGLGYNKISLATGLTVDFKKPNQPTINLGDGTSIAFESTSTDVAGFYVYNGQIPEVGTSTASNLLKKLTVAEAAAYGLCQSVDKLDWDDAAYVLNVIAVDGTGVLGKGNMSDTRTKAYVPMLKSAVLLEDSNAGASDATTEGTVYDSLCASAGAQTVNYGVTLTSEKDLQTVKMAYAPENVTDLTATPITLFVNAEDATSDVIAKITYADVYGGKTVYIQLESTVYSLKLPTKVEMETFDGAAIDNPLDLSDSGTSSVKQTDQSL